MTSDENILILEDDPDRLARFERVLAEVAPILPWRQWRDAHRMIRECPPYLESCRLICLDHDLAPIDGRDVGDGLDVARFLASRKVGCPILIHSSNGDRVQRMVGEFELVGVHVSTILPLGEHWLERYWRKKIEELI